MKVRRVLAAAAVCLFGAGSMTVTLAYLTDQEQIGNTLSAAENRIRIDETFDPPDEIAPGTRITKAPRIVNDSDISVYVRASVQFSDSAAEAFCMPLSINNGWSDGGDGYYYYDSALAPGSTSAALFDSVQIRSDISGEELIPFDILVYAESVQTCGTSGKEAWKL